MRNFEVGENTMIPHTKNSFLSRFHGDILLLGSSWCYEVLCVCVCVCVLLFFAFAGFTADLHVFAFCRSSNLHLHLLFCVADSNLPATCMLYLVLRGKT